MFEICFVGLHAGTGCGASARISACRRSARSLDAQPRSARPGSRDHQRINQDQLAYVRRRDADRLQTYRVAQRGHDSRYADARAEYGRKMAAWRRAVAACNAGHWEYCSN